MAYTTIDDGSLYFHTQLYAGDGNTNRDITNDANAGDFQPDFLWLKNRTDSSTQHFLFNSNVGMPNHLNSDLQDAEQTATNKATAFNADGFRVQDHSQVNASSKNYVAWQWKANGGTTTSFTESGSNPGGTHQANTTAGFSIVNYTGTGSAGTVQHGLSAVPQLIIIKDRGDSSNWLVYTEPTGNTHTLFLNRNVAKEDDATLYNDTTPTSSVFSLGAHNDVNANDDTYVAYCFTSIKGYSKIGSYTGNGNADGTFVYTGFKPAWLLVKDSSASENWMIYDNKRDPFNEVDANLKANENNAESDFDVMDFVSNGFKIRQTSGDTNNSGNTYIYMAFAEHPFVSSKGVPVTAR